MLPPDVSALLAGSAKLSQPTGQKLSNVRRQQKNSIGPILFLYYKESLVSSNLNSKQLRFHCVRPNVYGYGQWLRFFFFKNIPNNWPIWTDGTNKLWDMYLGYFQLNSQHTCCHCVPLVHDFSLIDQHT